MSEIRDCMYREELLTPGQLSLLMGNIALALESGLAARYAASLDGGSKRLSYIALRLGAGARGNSRTYFEAVARESVRSSHAAIGAEAPFAFSMSPAAIEHEPRGFALYVSKVDTITGSEVAGTRASIAQVNEEAPWWEQRGVRHFTDDDIVTAAQGFRAQLDVGLRYEKVWFVSEVETYAVEDVMDLLEGIVEP